MEILLVAGVCFLAGAGVGALMTLILAAVAAGARADRRDGRE